MSKEKAKQFLTEYRDNEEAMKILKQFPEPKTDEEAISCFVEAAGKIGLQITEEEMAEVLSREPELPSCCDSLLKMALDRGAPDNVTALILTADDPQSAALPL